MIVIEFDENEVDFFDGKYNSYNIFGHSDDVDYYLECCVDDDGINITSGHSIDDDSNTNSNLPFEEITKLLNNQIKINKYCYAD